MMMKRGDERGIPAGSMRAINHDLAGSFCFPLRAAKQRALAVRVPPPPLLLLLLLLLLVVVLLARGHICQDWEATECAHYINNQSLTSVQQLQRDELMI